jgi:protein phosphatase
LSWAAVSVAGNHRPTNQDAVVAAPPVFVVADGMGGHQFGEQASAAVVAAMTPLIGRRDLTVESIRQALDWAQQEIDQLTVRASTGQSRPANRTIRTAGATVAGLVLVRQDDQWQWLVVNVGDCRVYRLTEDDCEQITVDHTEVQELLDQGAISPAEVALHPRRHVVTRALGAGSEAEPDYWLLAPGGRERWLICSDGLSGELPADVVAAALEYDGEADQAATALLAAALRSRGRDNVSIIVVDAVFDPTTPAVPPLSRDSRMGTAQPCSSRSARTVPRI